MRRIDKSHASKIAFTLLEMVMVIAIIVILASALMLGVTGYIEGTKKANNLVAESAQDVEASIHASEAELSNKFF